MNTVAHSPAKPVLLYDGDCGFCTRTAKRLEHDAPERIAILRYQDSLSMFPELSEEKLKAAVHLVDVDGAVYVGADAIYRAGAIAGYTAKPAAWYQRSNLYRKVSDKGYAFVAANRYLISMLCRWFHGMDFLPHSYDLGRVFFSRLTGVLTVFSIFTLALVPDGLTEVLNVLAAVVAAGSGDAPVATFSFPAVWTWVGLISAALLIKGVAPLLTSSVALVSWIKLVSVVPESFRLVSDGLLAMMLLCVVLLSSLTLMERRWSPPWAGAWGRRLALWVIVLMAWGNLASQLGTHDANGSLPWLRGEGVQNFLMNQPAPGFGADQFSALPGSLLVLIVVAFGVIMPVATIGPRRVRRILAGGWMLFHLCLYFAGNYGLYPLMAMVFGLLLIDDQVFKMPPAKRTDEGNGLWFQLGKGTGAAIFTLAFVLGTTQLFTTLRGNSSEAPTQFAQPPEVLRPILVGAQNVSLFQLPVLAKPAPDERPWLKVVSKENGTLTLMEPFSLVAPNVVSQSYVGRDIRVDQFIYFETLVGLNVEKSRLFGALISLQLEHEELDTVSLKDSYGNVFEVDLLAWYEYLQKHQSQHAQAKDQHNHN